MLQTKHKPKIRNVVCTADLEQKVEVTKLSKLSCGTYDVEIYGGRCGYIKTPGMEGRVTVFPSGKMISVGGRSVEKAIQQLNQAKFFLVRENMVNEVILKPKIRNIVATIDFGKKIPIDVLSSKIAGAVYDPETFPGLILKGLDSCNFLIFSSGKIVTTGTKSMDEVTTASFELLERLNKFLD